MNIGSSLTGEPPRLSENVPAGPVLIVPYMWIGDFVRCHSVVKLLRARNPSLAIDVLATSMVAPLADYMPGIRRAIVADLPRKRLALADHRSLAGRLASENYREVLIMPRTWKSALAPYLAGIPTRTGFVGEMRLGLINDLRFGERRLPRMIDRCASLALAKGCFPPASWPKPEIKVPPLEVLEWTRRLGLDRSRPVVAFAPGAVGSSKRWPAMHYAELAKRLVTAGQSVWVLGGPDEKPFADAILSADPMHIREFTGPDLRNAILALAAAHAVVSNDSGLMHVAAALGKPTVGIFGPTSPWHWAPLNPLAGVMQAAGDLPCRPCHKPVCRLGHHRCMREIGVEQVLVATNRAIAVAHP